MITKKLFSQNPIVLQNSEKPQVGNCDFSSEILSENMKEKKSTSYSNHEKTNKNVKKIKQKLTEHCKSAIIKKNFF